MGAQRPDVPISPARQARLILAGGFSAVAAILAVWLVIWLIFFQASYGLRAFRVDVAPESSAAPSLLFMDEDVTALQPDAKHAARNLVEAVRTYLVDRKGQPAIVYISAPWLRSPVADRREAGKSPSTEVFRETLPDGPVDGVDLAEIIDAFKERRGKRLLILDVNRVGTDRELGAFGDDAVERLTRLVPSRPGTERPASELRDWKKSWEGFAVFASCAPGQWSWSSDLDGRSVFSHFLADALSRGRSAGVIGDSRTLFRWVTSRVHQWTREQRSAVQTPIVRGDIDLSFPLPLEPRLIPEQKRFRAATAGRAEEDRRAIAAALSSHYKLHENYQKASLFELDPFTWRDYRSAWLRAERFYRAGRLVEARAALEAAESARGKLAAIGDAGRLPSLALSLKFTAGTSEHDQLIDLDKALQDLVARTPGEGPGAR